MWFLDVEYHSLTLGAVSDSHTLLLLDVALAFPLFSMNTYVNVWPPLSALLFAWSLDSVVRWVSAIAAPCARFSAFPDELAVLLRSCESGMLFLKNGRKVKHGKVKNQLAANRQWMVNTIEPSSRGSKASQEGEDEKDALSKRSI